MCQGMKVKIRKLPLQIRIDSALEIAITDRAAKNSRSLTKEINHSLRKIYPVK